MVRGSLGARFTNRPLWFHIQFWNDMKMYSHKVVIFFFTYLAATVAQDIQIREVVIVFEGGVEGFTCVSNLGTTVEWLVNGTLLKEPYPWGVRSELAGRVGGNLIFENVPLEYDGTIVQCKATINGFITNTNNGTLLVQGLLDGVYDLMVEYEDSSFDISWDPPFSYIVPYVNPLITYCINITNSSSGEVAVSECGINVTHYSFQHDYDPCMDYTVTVIPVNRVGNGMPAQTSFPVPGYLRTKDATAKVMTDGNFMYWIPTMPYPVCSCEVTIFDTRPITTSCTVNGDNISFTSGGIALNEFYTANITLLNGRISSSSVITISTHDVQKLTVNNSVPNTISFLDNYALNSNARGVLFVMLFIDQILELVNFDRSAYAIVSDVISTPSLPNITRGTYIALAYDIERNGLLQLGTNSPAFIQRVQVTGTDDVQPSLPENDVCEVTAVNSSINVTCDTTDAGYQAVLHPNSIRSVETFMVEEINSNDSSVVFNASMNGPHSLTVFRKRNNGGIIINRKISSPVYRENIMVTGLPSTTTEPITDPPTTTNPTSPPTTTDPTVIQASGVRFKEEVIVFEGGSEAFYCISSYGTTVEWLVNGTPLEEPYPMEVTFETGGILKFNNVSLVHNGTTVQCIATTNDHVTHTNIGTLLVQGLLGAVNNLTVMFENSSFVISWDPPFSYIVPNIKTPLITYCINITNSSSYEVVDSECGITVTQYSFQHDCDSCMDYTVTVIPVNRVGNGMSNSWNPVNGVSDGTSTHTTGGSSAFSHSLSCMTTLMICVISSLQLY